MEANRPSRTAQGAAMHRAAHQLLDAPRVFEDPLALAIIGSEARLALESVADPRLQRRGLRAFLAVRSRYTEDCLAEAYARGVRQYVLLGAGLDTFAYRGAARFPGLMVFEVDHPATQGWKRERLREAGIAVPACVTYAPVDFERETVADGLARAGFDRARPAFFAWLGVVPYLTREAVLGTLGVVGKLAPGTEIVFDYSEPSERFGVVERAVFDAMAARVARAGEPFQSAFDPVELGRELVALGYSSVRDLDSPALDARYLAGRRDGLRLAGHGHLLLARV